MTERPRLLCAYDGSDAAAAAIRAAGALFAPATATVVTVRDAPPATDAAVLGRLALPEEEIARSLAELHAHDQTAARATAAEGAALASDAGLTASPSVLPSGPPWRAIRAAAQSLPADVLVCGTRGHGPIGRAMLGSTASSLLSATSHPILVVSGDRSQADGPAVIGYDGSAAAARAVRFAATWLRVHPLLVACVWRSPVRHSLDARVMHAMPVAELRSFVDEYDAAFEQAASERAGAGAREAIDLGGQATSRAVESGETPWRPLLRLAEAEGASVVVTGTARGRIASALAGSVAAGLVHHSELPVLVVPAPTGPEPSSARGDRTSKATAANT